MDSSKAIFIFTKNRPASLLTTLNSVRVENYPIYIIDDSSTENHRLITKKIATDHKNGHYLGTIEFLLFLQSHEIRIVDFSLSLRQLGNSDWNLGFARNFALLYSQTHRFEKVLFMDDDIIVPNPQLINHLFDLNNSYDFVGAHIAGLRDDSIVGHLAADLGFSSTRMLSGGFMSFKPATISHFFLNVYNEDWIWLFLQLKDKKYIQTQEVLQQHTDPFDNYKERVLFQEFGEIILDATIEFGCPGLYESLLTLDSWKDRVLKREKYLELLHATAKALNRKKYTCILEWLKLNRQYFEVNCFKKLFEDYFREKRKFFELYNSI